MLGSFSYIDLAILSFFNLIFFKFRFSFYNYLNLIDKSDSKLKKHTGKVYPIGGFIFLINILFFFSLNIFKEISLFEDFFSNDKDLIAFIFGSITLFLLGFFDDKYNLNYQIKIVVLAIVIYVCISIDNSLVISELNFSFIKNNIRLEELDKFFTILCFMIFINALNLFDGIDLQSGLYSLVIFITFGFLSNSNIFFYFIIPCIIFLILNHKKQVFLGDNGSILLGFIISYFSIKFYKLSILKSDEIFILMMIPGIDMMRLFILRISKGKNPFKGDRNHLHHILLEKFGYLKTIIIVQFIVLFSISLLFIFKISSIIIVISFLIIYLILIFKKIK